MIYSQNNEQHYITSYFKLFKGTFLDLGAYDGVHLSNTRALTENGWNGVLVEPDPIIFEKLKNNHKEYPLFELHKVAIGVKDGTSNFFSNDTFYGSLKIDHVAKWGSAGQNFSPIEVKQQTFKTFLSKCKYKTFDFISIDCEGVDYEILEQMDLKELGCKMICIEHNGIDTNKYIDYITKFGFRVHHINPENLIMISGN